MNRTLGDEKSNSPCKIPEEQNTQRQLKEHRKLHKGNGMAEILNFITQFSDQTSDKE